MIRMADDVIKMIIDNLRRIEEKQDTHTAQLAKIDSRLAVVEAKMVQQEAINKRVQELEALKDRGLGVKQIVAWLVATGIAVASYFK